METIFALVLVTAGKATLLMGYYDGLECYNDAFKLQHRYVEAHVAAGKTLWCVNSDGLGWNMTKHVMTGEAEFPTLQKAPVSLRRRG